MDVLFLMSIFRLYQGFKKSFEDNSVRKTQSLSACFRWDSRLSLREMNQKVKFGRTIGYGDSYLEFLFRHFKLFRLHVILHEAAGAVRAHSGKGPGYWYMIGRGPNSCLLCHVTGLLFCLFVKIFLPSNYNSADFWNSMSLIVLDIELTDKDIVKELGLYFDGSLQGFSFCPPKILKPNKQTTLNTSHLHEFAWSSGKLDYDKFFAVFYDIKVMNAEVFANGLEKCRLLIRLLGQNVENLDDYGWPKIQDLVKTDGSWICSRYPFRHKKAFTVPRGKQRRMENGLCNICKFLYVCIVFVFTTNSILSTRHDFFYSIHFEKSSLRNR